MKTPRLIVCATDLSEGSDPVIVEADAWAKRFDAGLVFVHGLPEASRSHVLFPHLAQATLNRLPSSMSLAADAVAGRVERLTSRPRADLDVRVDVGSPASIIVSVAEELGADLIMLGAASGSDTTKPLGSVALRVVRHAHCPVLVVRQPPVSGPVVAATDLSDPAFPAIVAGAFLAESLGVDLAVVHVAEVPLPAPMDQDAVGLGLSLGYEMTSGDYQRFREAAGDRLTSALKKLGLSTQTLIEDGIPAASIVAASRRLHAGILVIGTEGRSALRRMLLGSTAEQILKDSTCSVLVVRLASHGGPS